MSFVSGKKCPCFVGGMKTPADEGGRDGAADVQFTGETERLFDPVGLSLETDREDLRL
jgi:hypothetical protein